ncbi:hypothetical protein BY996DRAFT_6413766 [Phakopsora pachyrhizi]|nr:hypothetical protein BY996DRAFT_6413766 [Phakopsora pachyrhizi]
MFSSNTPVQTCRKSFRAFTNQLVNRNNTHNQQPHTQQHQQARQPPSEELINTNGQQPQATVNNNGIGGQLEDQKLPLASLILGHLVKNQPETTQTIQPTHCTTLIRLWFNNNKPNNKQQQQQQLINILNINQQQHPLTLSLSASSHAKSHDLNKSFGWWEKLIGHGPNYPIDLDQYFVICKNILGSCYGSTRPSSINPETNEPMGPISQSSQSLTRLGSSMGGMQSIVTAWLKPQRTQRMTLEEHLAQRLSTGGASEDPGKTVGLDNGCKKSPETDRYGWDSIQQTLLSQEDQKDENPVK